MEIGNKSNGWFKQRILVSIPKILEFLSIEESEEGVSRFIHSFFTWLLGTWKHAGKWRSTQYWNWRWSQAVILEVEGTQVCLEKKNSFIGKVKLHQMEWCFYVPAIYFFLWSYIFFTILKSNDENKKIDKQKLF